MTETGTIVTENALPDLGCSLFIQAPQARNGLVRDLVASQGLGVVYSLDPRRRKRDPRAEARAIVDYTRHKAPDAAILLDANRYSGKNRKIADLGLTPGWTQYQLHHCSVPYALTDSWYVGRSDTRSLDQLLTEAGKLGPRVITVLPLHWKWLTEDLDTLKDRLETHARPVALALEHNGDPMGEKGAAAGLCTLLQSGIPLLLLRSDTSALGALAYGAGGVSVGTESGLRHIYPLTKGGGTGPKTSVLIPELLTYYLLDKAGDAMQLNPDLAIWNCSCLHCAGRRIDWFRFNDDAADHAFAHSLGALANLGRSITSTPQHKRPDLWTDMCQQAQLKHFTVKTGEDGETWEGKSVLGKWAQVTPTRIGG
jgi:hypothetical protein